MANFPITIEIEASSEAEAIEKIESFIKLNDSMDHQDFVECADFVADYPTVVTTIKNTLPKISDKSTFELVACAPDIIKEIKTSLAIDQANLEAEYEDEEE
jgi:hypothetical protein